MLGVLPEVVDMAVMGEAGRRDAVLGLDDLQRLLMQGLVAGIALQNGEGARVVGLDPLHRPLALNLFKPQIGIGRVAGREAARGWSGRGGGGLGHGYRGQAGGGEKRRKRDGGSTDHGQVPENEAGTLTTPSRAASRATLPFCHTGGTRRLNPRRECRAACRTPCSGRRRGRGSGGRSDRRGNAPCAVGSGPGPGAGTG